MVKTGTEQHVPGWISTTLREPNEVGDFTAWDVDFRQIASGSGLTKVAVRPGSLLTTLSIAMPSRVHQVGAAPADILTFGIPKPGTLSRWLGTEAPRLPLVCFGSGHAFDGVSEAGFEAVTVSISKAGLAALVRDLGFDQDSENFGPAIIDLERTGKLARQIASNSRGFADPNAQDLRHEDEDELAVSLLLAMAGGDMSEDRTTPRMRDRVLKRALEAIEGEEDAPPSIRELCVLSGASWPTLRRAFVERFGVSPKSYVMALRLNRARKDILQSGPDGTIVEAANRWGFWHMGQFAKDYKRFFGRLPSEDLRH